MAISFEKHRAQIIAAWKDVLDDKSSTNWSLYSYEGQTNELKVMGSGEGGTEELCEDLNSGKIMYAFVRIEDPKTGLKKFLLINWQGEGAPVLRKGTCANHIHDVAKLLHGAHLTINARNEDDIDLERLLKKLSAVSSAYSFKEPRTGMDDAQKTPIGTNYTRVIPTKELNASVMQDFWKREEAEERRRLDSEKAAKQAQSAAIETEQRQREEKEHLAREKQVVGLSKLQPAHVPIKTSPQPLSPEKTVASFNAGLTEAERMRQLRNQEARELIGSRVGAAKAIFTKNTSEGQLQTKLNTAPPAKPARTSIAQRINAFNQPPQQEQTAASAASAQPPPAKIALPKATVTVAVEKAAAAAPKDQPPQRTAAAVNAAPAAVKEAEAEAPLPPPAAFAAAPHAEPAAPVAAVAPVVIVAAAAAATAAAVAPSTLLEAPVTPEITANIADDVQPQQADDQDGGAALDENEAYSTIKRSPHSKTSSLPSPDETTSSSNATDTALFQDGSDDDEGGGVAGGEVRTKVSVTVQQAQSAKNGIMMTSLERAELSGLVANEDELISDTFDQGLRARALYDYQAADDTEITFDPGDVITHIDQIDEGWWQGLGPDGTYGLFPANYVEIII